jgi:hypothetical protein
LSGSVLFQLLQLAEKSAAEGFNPRDAQGFVNAADTSSLAKIVADFNHAGIPIAETNTGFSFGETRHIAGRSEGLR